MSLGLAFPGAASGKDLEVGNGLAGLSPGSVQCGVTKLLTDRMRGNSILPRVVPFLIFLGLTFCQGQIGEASRYWIYLAKTLVGGWMLWAVWDLVPECRWKIGWEAVLVGIAVCVVWVGLDPYVPSLNDILVKFGLSKPKATPDPMWNPHAFFGPGSAMAWFFVIVRILGSSVVVPPLEETFYRGFVYRFIANPDFEKHPLSRFHPLGFFVTAAVFGLAHNEWLAGILCGMAYQWLVLRKGRLGDAMAAHAITNFLLGLWVVNREAWKFW